MDKKTVLHIGWRGNAHLIRFIWYLKRKKPFFGTEEILLLFGFSQTYSDNI